MKTSSLAAAALLAAVAVALPIANQVGYQGEKDTSAAAGARFLDGALASNSSGSPPLPFAWKSCGKPGDPVTFTELGVEPTPITFSKTTSRPITLSMTAAMTTAITAGTSFSLLIKKRVPFTTTFEKIPCVEQYGSCTYPDLCASLNDLMPTCNDWFDDHKISCHCPFAPQSIAAAPSAFNIPPVGDTLPSWLADGDFQVTVTALDGKGGEIGCLYMQMTLKLEK